MTVSAQYSFSSGSTIASAEVNDNFNRLYLDSTGNLGLANYDAEHNTDGTHGSITATSIDLLGNQIVSGNVTVSGNVVVTGNITQTGDLTVTGNVTVTGNELLSGSLVVSGQVTFQNNVNFNVTASFSSDIKLLGALSTASVTASSVLVTGSVTIDKMSSMGTADSTGSAGDLIITVEAAPSNINTAADLVSAQITTTGRPVLLSLQCSTTTADCFISIDATATQTLSVSLGFYRDATQLTRDTVYFKDTGSSSTRSIRVPANSISFIDTPIAGTYIYKFSVVAIQAGTYFNGRFKLVAFEI